VVIAVLVVHEIAPEVLFKQAFCHLEKHKFPSSKETLAHINNCNPPTQ
jgi:hypothetical protein